MENFQENKQSERLINHQKFIEEVHRKAEEEIKNSKPRPNSIEDILNKTPKFIKVFKDKEKSNLWKWKQ